MCILYYIGYKNISVDIVVCPTPLPQECVCRSPARNIGVHRACAKLNIKTDGSVYSGQRCREEQAA